ncbi:MAG: response regulator [Planctomycetota bacterium]
MTTRKDVFTTGQVAKICQVTIRTVIKWFEAGKLEGYKIPASKDRRIPKEALLRFLVEHKIPFDQRLFDSRPKLLIADDDEKLVRSLAELFEKDGDLDVQVATGGYQAGFETMRIRPTLLLIDYNLGDTTAYEVVETIKGVDQLKEMSVIIMTGYLEDQGVGELEKEGLRVVKKPLDIIALKKEVRAAMGLAATPA